MKVSTLLENREFRKKKKENNLRIRRFACGISFLLEWECDARVVRRFSLTAPYIILRPCAVSSILPCTLILCVLGQFRLNAELTPGRTI